MPRHLAKRSPIPPFDPISKTSGKITLTEAKALTGLKVLKKTAIKSKVAKKKAFKTAPKWVQALKKVKMFKIGVSIGGFSGWWLG